MFKKAFATSVAFASVASLAFASQKSYAQPKYYIHQGTYAPRLYDIQTKNNINNQLELTGIGYKITPNIMLENNFNELGSKFVPVITDLSDNSIYPDLSNNIVRFNDLNVENKIIFNDLNGNKIIADDLSANKIITNDLNATDLSANSLSVSDLSVNTLKINSADPSIGDGSRASGQRSAAFGAGAIADFDNSTAVGEGAVTTRSNQIVLGRQSTEVTIPNLSGSGSAVLNADSDGTLRRLSVTGAQLESAVKTKIPKLENAARDLGRAVQTSTAVSAAMSAVPDLTLQEDEPVRCGLGAGGSGSQYAAAAGCAARITDRVHVNGALSLAPTVDYGYGSMSSVAGRIGVSFPLGPINKSKSSDRDLISQLQKENSKQSDLIRSQKVEIDQLRDDLARVLKRLELD